MRKHDACTNVVRLPFPWDLEPSVILPEVRVKNVRAIAHLAGANCVMTTEYLIVIGAHLPFASLPWKRLGGERRLLVCILSWLAIPGAEVGYFWLPRLSFQVWLGWF